MDVFEQLSVQEFVVIVEAKDNTSAGTCLTVARERRVPRSMPPAAHAAHVETLFIMQVLPNKAILTKTMPNADVLFAATEGGEGKDAEIALLKEKPVDTNETTCTWEVSRPTLHLLQWSSAMYSRRVVHRACASRIRRTCTCR